MSQLLEATSAFQLPRIQDAQRAGHQAALAAFWRPRMVRKLASAPRMITRAMRQVRAERRAA